MRALLKIGHRCNNRCTFCHATDRAGEDSLPRILSKLQKARAMGAHTVVLSGGEPTLHPELLAIARGVQDLGMKLGLVTNGRWLARPEIVEPLLHAGLDYAYLSLHAPDASIHDELVGASGAFEETLAALRALHGRVGHLWSNTVVTTRNLEVLPSMIDVLGDLPDCVMKFTLPQPKGDALANFDQVVPELSQASAAVRAAFERALNAGHEKLGHEGVPLCLLPGHEHRRDDLRTHRFLGISELADEGFEPVDDLLRAWPPPCQGCSLRASCPGMYRETAARRGWSELRPSHGQPQTVAHATPRGEWTAPSPAGSGEGWGEGGRADDLHTREQASHEQRCWVRLAWGCNNACLFCLDKQHGRTGERSEQEIRRDIVEGRRKGADRLVLSGGEPTTNRRFLDYVRVGRLAGYRWIQTVSNGRMFRYPEFLERAIAAGLDELTVSLHGHTPELHDELVGVRGAFAQSSQAVQAALRSKRVVVNVDVVINARNVDHLPAMIDTFAGWGVREFDLLHIIPFGSAWNMRDRGLFYDPKDKAEPIRAALQTASRHGARVWLNRFPPEHAEGFESLIQDPHKLLDEVRGREGELLNWIRTGEPISCRDTNRCSFCYLRGMCDSLQTALSAISAGHPARIVARAPIGERVPKLTCDELELACDSEAECIEAIGRISARALRVRTASVEWIGDARVTAVQLPDVSQLPTALRLPEGIDIEVEARRSDWQAIVEASCSRLVVRQPTHDRLSAALDQDVEPSLIRQATERGARTRGVVACIGGRVPEGEPFVIDLGVLGDDGLIDPHRFAAWWAREGFRSKSLRCRSCSHDNDCVGMPINWIRAHGFASLVPVR